MKIFAGIQIRELDRYTIENEPIKSIDLMERAALSIVKVISFEWSNSVPVVVFAGPGNNGGDALAVGRLMAEEGYDVRVWLFNTTGKISDDCSANRDRLRECGKVKSFTGVTQEFEPPKLEKGMIVVDGLFGSGLNKPLSGGFASLVKYINASDAEVVSIDVPSGLMTENNADNVRANIIRAKLTITLQNKKLAFLFAENQEFIGRLVVADIGLSRQGMEIIPSSYSVMEKEQVRSLLRPRDPFAHKGSMGHALLIAGCYGMAGAAILAAKACLRSGAGKVTVHSPRQNNMILQVAVPEAIVQADSGETVFGEPVDTQNYSSLGIGPGLGTNESTAISLITQLRRTKCPIVADADALNILSNHRSWLQQLPKGVILTPHPREFDRLYGMPSTDSYDRLQKAIELAGKFEIYIILKGHNSALCLPDGNVVFCPTGNAGMATAGSGDVLTGIITALLARGYARKESAILGMYLHGLSGDIATEQLGMESVVAGDIIECIPKAFRRLEEI